jgi:hypothetical protein
VNKPHTPKSLVVSFISLLMALAAISICLQLLNPPAIVRGQEDSGIKAEKATESQSDQPSFVIP